jgi:hypothetical protein
MDDIKWFVGIVIGAAIFLMFAISAVEYVQGVIKPFLP